MSPKEALAQALAERIVEGMDMDTLVTYAMETLFQNYSSYTEDQLRAEVSEYAPDLLD